MCALQVSLLYCTVYRIAKLYGERAKNFTVCSADKLHHK